MSETNKENVLVSFDFHFNPVNKRVPKGYTVM